jgi:hypothetical protein
VVFWDVNGRNTNSSIPIDASNDKGTIAMVFALRDSSMKIKTNHVNQSEIQILE